MKTCYVKTFAVALSVLALSGCITAPEPENIVVPESIQTNRTNNSLWGSKGIGNMLFVDNKAHYKEDIVTVLIEEKSQAEKNATTETDDESTLDVGINSFLGTQLKNANILSSGAIGSGTLKDFKGNGKTTRSGNLTAIIATKIVDILENGNFYLEGKREIKVNNEMQLMSISGTVRPKDIAFDNTVLSRYIADAKISYSGIGVISDKQHPGWGVRILDWIWPF